MLTLIPRIFGKEQDVAFRVGGENLCVARLWVDPNPRIDGGNFEEGGAFFLQVGVCFFRGVYPETDIAIGPVRSGHPIASKFGRVNSEYGVIAPVAPVGRILVGFS